MEVYGIVNGSSDDRIKLAETYTDADGQYNVICDISNVTGVYIKMHPKGENCAVISSNGIGYTISSNTYDASTDDLTIDLSIPTSLVHFQAMQICQATTMAARYAKTMIDAMDSVNYTGNPFYVTIVYPHNNTELNHTSYYDDQTETINIEGIQANDIVMDGQVLHSYAAWDSIQHEYFHHIQNKFNIDDSPGGWHDLDGNMWDHYNAHHSTDSTDLTIAARCKSGVKEINCANPSVADAKSYALKISYAEGMATVLASMSQLYYGSELQNIKTVGDTAYTANNGVEFDLNKIHRRSLEKRAKRLL